MSIAPLLTPGECSTLISFPKGEGDYPFEWEFSATVYLDKRHGKAVEWSVNEGIHEGRCFLLANVGFDAWNMKERDIAYAVAGHLNVPVEFPTNPVAD